MITIKETSKLLQISNKHIYRLIEKCRTNKQNIFSYGGLSFYIFRTGKGVTLEPVTEKNVDIEDIENRAASAVFKQLIPCLCEHCQGPAIRIRDEYLK
jgi:hypothetical protein